MVTSLKLSAFLCFCCMTILFNAFGSIKSRYKKKFTRQRISFRERKGVDSKQIKRSTDKLNGIISSLQKNLHDQSQSFLKLKQQISFIVDLYNKNASQNVSRQRQLVVTIDSMHKSLQSCADQTKNLATALQNTYTQISEKISQHHEQERELIQEILALMSQEN